MKIKKSKLESAPRFKNLYFLFPKPASLQTFNMHTRTADSSFKEFFFFFKKAHSDVNHRKMGRDQKKNDILFVFLYFRETASLTSSLNGTPKQLEALHVQTLVTQVWSGSIVLFLCFLTESGIVLSTGLSPFITRL